MAIIRLEFTRLKNAIIERELAKMEIACEAIEAEAKRLCPVDKGNLYKSFSHDVRIEGNEIIGTVKNSAEYAAAVEFGTKPHEIRPRDKKALAFQSPGGFNNATGKALYLNRKSGRLQKSKTKNTAIITKVVHHPGTQGIPFLRGAMISMKRRVLEILSLQ